MMVWVWALFALTAALYLFASIAFVRGLFGGAKGETVSWAPHLVASGALFHAAHIVVASFVLHVCPVHGVHFSMSVASMLACALYAAVRLRFRIDAVGVFVAPLGLTFLLASQFVVHEPTHARSLVLPLHVAANLLGVALFTLSSASAALYLFQERRLKEKRAGARFRNLPPLESLERAEHRFLLFGFPLLTFGVVSGSLWAKGVEVGEAADVARALFGYASWIVFALVLLSRAALGWRGRRAAYGTLCGFLFTLIVLFVYVLRPTAKERAAAPGESGSVG